MYDTVNDSSPNDNQIGVVDTKKSFGLNNFHFKMLSPKHILYTITAWRIITSLAEFRYNSPTNLGKFRGVKSTSSSAISISLTKSDFDPKLKYGKYKPLANSLNAGDGSISSTMIPKVMPNGEPLLVTSETQPVSVIQPADRPKAVANLPVTKKNPSLYQGPKQAEDATLCILPIGDSITESKTGYKSWRYQLWKKLITLKYKTKVRSNKDATPTTFLKVDFAGSQSHNFDHVLKGEGAREKDLQFQPPVRRTVMPNGAVKLENVVAKPGAASSDPALALSAMAAHNKENDKPGEILYFPTHHEGHWGWRTDQILGGWRHVGKALPDERRSLLARML